MEQAVLRCQCSSAPLGRRVLAVLVTGSIAYLVYPWDRRGPLLWLPLFWLAHAGLTVVRLRDGTVLDADGVTVRTAFRKREVRWSDVTEVLTSTRWDTAVKVRTRSGDLVVLAHVPTSDVEDVRAIWRRDAERGRGAPASGLGRAVPGGCPYGCCPAARASLPT